MSMTIGALIKDLDALIDSFAERQRDLAEQIYMPESEYLEDKIIEVERIKDYIRQYGITGFPEPEGGAT